MNDTSRDPSRELLLARDGLLLVPTPFDALLVTGRDRVSWLNGMVTSDVAKQAVGSAGYGLHVGKTGKIGAEVWIHVGEADVLVAVPPGRGGELAAALDRYLIMERCEIAPATTPTAFTLAWGPEASAAVSRARALGLRGGVAHRAGLPVALVSGAPEGVLAWEEAEVHGAATRGRASTAGWERTRIELGVGTFGVDFDDSAYPQEAALEGDGVSFSKGCYLGQEAVFMMQERGHPPRRLVQLQLEGEAALPTPADVSQGDGASVGRVTSIVGRPEGALALATVKWKAARPGTELSVAGRKAVVTPLLAVAAPAAGQVPTA